MPENRKKKIALLMNSFWNAGSGGLSGGDQRAIQIFKRLAGFYKLDIYTSIDGAKVVGDQIIGANVIVSGKKLNQGNLLLTYFKRTLWARKEILKGQYDLVYSSSDFLPDVLPCCTYVKKSPKARFVQCIFHHYPVWFRRPGNKILNLIGSFAQSRSFSLIRRHGDAILNINYQVKEYLISELGFERKKIFINPCGIDLDYLKKLKSEKKANEATFLARLNPSKGIFDLPKIWRMVVDKIPEAKLIIIGGGSEETKEDLHEKFKALDLLANVEIRGFLPNEEAFKIVKGSNVFISPSHEEGFGMNIAEALACSVPAVAWNLSVYKEVFPKGVVTVGENNYREFSEAIVKIFEDRSYSTQLVNDGIEIVQKYGWEGIALTEKKMIDQVLEEKNAKADI